MKDKLEFALADSADYLDAKAWDELTAGHSFFLQRPYLRALARSAPPEVRPRAALLYKRGRPMAALALQAVKLASPVAGLTPRAVICGNLFSWGRHGAAFAVGADPGEAWDGVSEALYRLRRCEKRAGRADLALIKDIFEGDEEGCEALRDTGYRPLETEPNMVLELSPSWRTYDDYLAGLQSRYRKNAVRVARELEAGGCVVERLLDLTPHALRLHALYMQVVEAASVRPAALTPAYLPALSEAAGGRMRCSVIRRGDEILAFSTTLREEDGTGVGYYLGYERGLREELPLYFGLLQAVVADAIALGCSRLSLGRTALEPKANLGAKPVRTRLWVRASNPLLNAAARPLVGALPRAQAPERHPFKVI